MVEFVEGMSGRITCPSLPLSSLENCSLLRSLLVSLASDTRPAPCLLEESCLEMLYATSSLRAQTSGWQIARTRFF